MFALLIDKHLLNNSTSNYCKTRERGQGRTICTIHFNGSSNCTVLLIFAISVYWFKEVWFQDKRKIFLKRIHRKTVSQFIWIRSFTQIPKTFQVTGIGLKPIIFQFRDQDSTILPDSLVWGCLSIVYKCLSIRLRTMVLRVWASSQSPQIFEIWSYKFVEAQTTSGRSSLIQVFDMINTHNFANKLFI